LVVLRFVIVIFFFFFSFFFCSLVLSGIRGVADDRLTSGW
jgi:hypothetical protein